MLEPTFPHHIPSIPYTSPPTPLQTLDIWLPRSLSASPPESTVWIIYIHGGAWRDPVLDSTQLAATISHLLPPNSGPPSEPTSGISRIAALASLSHRLSPYPSHPTSPSSPSDPSRNARHPDHIADICAALTYLSENYGLRGWAGEGGYQWIGVGHSAGATMWMQYAGGIDIPTSTPSLALGISAEDKVRAGLKALILLAGIFDLPLLVQNHSVPAVSSGIAQIYRDFVTGAFGKDERGWAEASPVGGRYGKREWAGGELVVVAHSAEDELVEREQGEAMEKVLRSEGWVGERGRVREVWRRGLKGAHDFVWEDGEQIAELVREVVGWLFKEGRVGEMRR